MSLGVGGGGGDKDQDADEEGGEEGEEEEDDEVEDDGGVIFNGYFNVPFQFCTSFKTVTNFMNFHEFFRPKIFPKEISYSSAGRSSCKWR